MPHVVALLPDTRAATLRGIAWMVAAMAGFATEDVFLKVAVQTVPVWQVMVLLGFGGGAVFWLWARARGRRVLGPDLLLRPILIRNAGEAVGTVCFTTALALTPLVSVSAILQATPLAVTLGAAVFLGARVGWRRWTAIVIGLAGVLLVLRPGMDAFQPASLLAVAAVLCLGARDLATRAVPARIASEVLATQGFIAAGLAGLVIAPFGAPPILPGPAQAAALCAALPMGVFGYYAITAAMRAGDIATVTPFRYTRLIFALGYGVALFGERPDAATLTGAAIIVASGLYTVLRERRRDGAG
jgi:drug/metabolite transporter (DMT)-like permease